MSQPKRLRKDAKASFTPGPWSYKAGSIAPAICAVTELGSRQIASMTVYDRDEQTSNARLIAAAPTMIELLETVFTQLKKRPVYGEKSLTGYEENVMCEIEKLLSKIGGEE